MDLATYKDHKVKIIRYDITKNSIDNLTTIEDKMKKYKICAIYLAGDRLDIPDESRQRITNLISNIITTEIEYLKTKLEEI